MQQISVSHQPQTPKQQTLNLQARSSGTWLQKIKNKDIKQIKSIILAYCGIDDNKVRQLFGIYWQQLRHLNLFNNNISKVGLGYLSCTNFPKLNSITLDSNMILDGGIQVILRIFNSKLINLQISKCGVLGNGVRMMLGYDLGYLENLNLSYNQIGSKGIKWLTKLTLPNLNNLIITKCQSGQQGNKHLTKSKWNKLNSLCFSRFDLSRNKMKLDSWSVIYLNNWKNLKKLYIFENQPICCLNVVVLPSVEIKIEAYLFKIVNRQFLRSIQGILQARNILI